MTDTSARPAPADTARWEGRSTLRTVAELLLGLSFTVAVAFGGYAASTGRMVVVSQAAGIVFVITLTCVLVSWFRTVERADTTATARTADPIASIDAEYRR
ncbi:hypothetical protein ACTJKO_15155 [Curtobacterium sp. 22159]|uniref:hypothetical protein n=1 Tax=Curtobacterium sp. 22159 TaxID=3453882 RepID=UPI003F82C58D